jgi:glycosyltransferase involved in cell wall biosynthesis
VGRIAPEKKNDIVLRAFAELLKKVPDASLAFGGHGSFEGEMKKLAQELGVEDRVHFLGTLTKKEVAELYYASDVYAIASLSETQSMSLIQAFATGLPAVGVRWRAIPEYLSPERGFLFERNNIQEMAQHMEIVLTDESLRHKLGRNAASFAQRFSVEKVADEWEEIYQGVLS